MSSTRRTVTADRGDAGRRLDLVLRRHLTDIGQATRTRIQLWIENGHVAINGRSVHRVAARAALGDVVTIELPRDTTAVRHEMAAENTTLETLYQDEHLMAVDKPAGTVVHPAYGNTTGTMMNALLWHARGWPRGQRPSLVGRLDKGTSGVLLVAKTAVMHAALQRAMASIDAEKRYLAAVYGRVTPLRGGIRLPLTHDPRDRRKMTASEQTGAPSLTWFERLACVPAPRGGLSLLACRLATGRTHQIRVHLAARGWPVIGDTVYGEPRWRTIADTVLAAKLRDFPRQALHASRVAFSHPITRARITIEAPPPQDLAELLALSGLTD
jgi:23S rRNA pseudouridine1911/1915/1917 synthase